MNTVLRCRGLPGPRYNAITTIPSLPTHVPTVIAFARYPSARRLFLVFSSDTGVGFTSTPLARRERKPLSSSSSYGLVVHLQLLPTSPHGDAVIFGFRPESVCLTRAFTLPALHAAGRTEPRGSPRASIDIIHAISGFEVSARRSIRASLESARRSPQHPRFRAWWTCG